LKYKNLYVLRYQSSLSFSQKRLPPSLKDGIAVSTCCLLHQIQPGELAPPYLNNIFEVSPTVTFAARLTTSAKSIGFNQSELSSSLVLSGSRILTLHFPFSAELFTCLRFACRVPDHSGKIPDNQLRLMTGLLKLAQLVQNNGMPDMNIGADGSSPARC
jgi:hypothetical protein